MPQQSELRVFISSTFHDLQAEREYLVKKVFPEIRQMCRNLGVEFTEIDLRWGLTEEEAAHGKIIRTCLEEIDRCRPYFIGIIANRYGWSPQFHDIQKDSELISHYPWIEDAITDERSIIDIEFEYGGLQQPSTATAAYFYVKSDESSHTYTPTQSEKKKVDKLKDTVRSSGLPVKTFNSAEELGQFVRQDLIHQITARWSSDNELTPLELERAAHQAFAISRRKAYIINPDYLQQFTKFIETESDGKPLVIVGDSGIGKSSLVAYLAHTSTRRNKDTFTIEHYVGATSDAADHTTVIRHIISEIQSKFAPDDELPVTSIQIVNDFQLWLSKIPTKAIIFIDAVNQLEATSSNMSWLPPYVPANVQFVISTTNQEPLKHLRDSGCRELAIRLLSIQEREAMIVRFLGEYHKALSPAQCRLIASNEQSASPLFLRTVLEELRLFSVFDDIDTAISEYLKARDLKELFQIVLARLERDHGHLLVKELLSLVWVSRRGLSESELLDLYNQTVKNTNNTLTRLEFSQLISALDYHLIRKDGLLNFFHQYLRSAVEDRYLKKKMHIHSLHRRLGSYFRSQPISNRRTDEEPFHWQRGEAWDEFNECLMNIPMLETLLGEDRIYELIGYWLILREHFDAAAEYHKAIKKFELETTDEHKIADIYEKLGCAFHSAGTYKPAEHFLRRSAEIRKTLFGVEHVKTADSYNELGKLLIAIGQYDEGEIFSRKANEIYLNAFGQMHLRTAESIANLATLLYSRGKYGESEALFRQALTIREKLFGKENKETIQTLSDLASVLFANGELSEPERLFREAVILSKKTFNSQDIQPAIYLNNLGNILKRKGELHNAIEFFKDAYSIISATLGPKHIDTLSTKVNIGVTERDLGQLKESEATLTECLNRAHQTIQENHPLSNAINYNIARLFDQQLRYDEALVFYNKVLEYQTTITGLNNREAINTLYYIGTVYSKKDNPERANEILTRSLTISQELFGEEHPLTQRSLQAIALL